jgi:DUF971 family protein
MGGSVAARARLSGPKTARLAARSYNHRIDVKPLHLDLKKDRGLTVAWDDGTTSFYSIVYLRKMSPSADNRTLKEQLKKNPLTVLPASVAKQTGPITALDAEFVGNYAIKIRFSDGHDTGLYSWRYLREIDPANTQRERPQREEASRE